MISHRIGCDLFNNRHALPMCLRAAGFWLGVSADLGWACSCVSRVRWLLAILSGLGWDNCGSLELLHLLAG